HLRKKNSMRSPGFPSSSRFLIKTPSSICRSQLTEAPALFQAAMISAGISWPNALHAGTAAKALNKNPSNRTRVDIGHAPLEKKDSRKGRIDRLVVYACSTHKLDLGCKHLQPGNCVSRYGDAFHHDL